MTAVGQRGFISRRNSEQHVAMSVRTGLGAAAGIVALLLAGCSNDIGTDTEGGGDSAHAVEIDDSWNAGGKVTIEEPSADAAAGKKLAYIGFGKDNPWSEWMFKAVEAEAAQWGATATFVGPPTFDAQAQFQIVSDMATSGEYDALLLVPNDSASIVPAVERLGATGVPIVAVSQPVGPDILSHEIQAEGVVAQVVEDLTMNATAMADGVIAACEGIDPCKVDVLWGARSLLFDKVKPEIFYRALEGHDNIELVCETDAGYTQDLGRTQAADCLQANPDLNVIASQADESTRGAEASVQAAGRTFGPGEGDIQMVSSYASVYGIGQVRAGVWNMTSYNRPQSMGRAGVRLALLALEGKQVPEYVRMEDLDGAPFALTQEILRGFPDVVGQWEG